MPWAQSSGHNRGTAPDLTGVEVVVGPGQGVVVLPLLSAPARCVFLAIYSAECIKLVIFQCSMLLPTT